MIVAIEVI